MATTEFQMTECVVRGSLNKVCQSGTPYQPDIRLCLISGKLLSLINPAQENQAIRQTKEIHEKCTSITYTGHCKFYMPWTCVATTEFQMTEYVVRGSLNKVCALG